MLNELQHNWSARHWRIPRRSQWAGGSLTVPAVGTGHHCWSEISKSPVQTSGVRRWSAWRSPYAGGGTW